MNLYKYQLRGKGNVIKLTVFMYINMNIFQSEILSDNILRVDLGG
jgi:hypothetical protein